MPVEECGNMLLMMRPGPDGPKRELAKKIMAAHEKWATTLRKRAWT